ncbi:hypothetical protein NIES2100_59730 [Calothrix sp. NIES-2100]|uniref:hypothetical protein n=1 Tax=Calothrix sp. NIES-2100 TaxID=1954172 RepID=UPI000B60001E|nr:hypothetical protein NIES2100_59730 [Calothrix sp. NIES-2100]
MIRKIYAIPLALSMSLCTGLSACTQQKTISAATPVQTPIPVQTPTSKTTPKAIPLTSDVKARKFLESYFNEITTGGFNGSTYYCKSSNAFTFYSPRKYEILKILPGKENSMIARTRIESSNAGGVPIIKNWTFLMKNEKPESSSSIKEAAEYGYCIFIVTDQF